jgi:ERF superfamily
MTAIQTIPTIQTPEPLTPMQMIQEAAQRGNLDVVAKLMDLQERWEKNQSRKAFDNAIAAAKSELKPVIRNREGHNKKKYADFAAIAAAVDPVLSKHKIYYRFRSETGDRITVTCILSHEGHHEESTLSGPPDKTGNKNDIQAIGSTLTYLQRYSLMQMLGLAAADDDDGNSADAGEKITEAQVTELIDLCEAVGADRGRFLKYLKIETMAGLPEARFADAKAALKAKVAKRD